MTDAEKEQVAQLARSYEEVRQRVVDARAKDNPTTDDRVALHVLEAEMFEAEGALVALKMQMGRRHIAP